MQVLILAGGHGSRLWPLSNKQRPKQLQAILSEQSLLQETVARALLIAPAHHITIVVSNDFQLAEVRAQLPKLPPENILREPLARNTAAAIAYGVAHLAYRRNGIDEVVAVLSADHAIANPEELAATVARAGEFLTQSPDYLVTIGITPTYPESGYGYIARGEELANGVFAVDRFTEKPDRATAEQYITAGYLWNAGIFVWRARAILERLARDPALARLIAAVKDGTDPAPAYQALANRSIDYTVLEGDRATAVVPTTLAWRDVGSWQAVRDHQRTAPGANVVEGQHIGIDTADCLIINRGNRLIATAGIDNLVIVSTDDGILICPIDRAQDVRRLVESIDELSSTDANRAESDEPTGATV